MLALIQVMPFLGFFVIRMTLFWENCVLFFCKGVKSNLYSAMILFYLLVHLETFNEVTKKVLIDGIKRGGGWPLLLMGKIMLALTIWMGIRPLWFFSENFFIVFLYFFIS